MLLPSRVTPRTPLTFLTSGIAVDGMDAQQIINEAVEQANENVQPQYRQPYGSLDPDSSTSGAGATPAPLLFCTVIATRCLVVGEATPRPFRVRHP